jgi:chemotaxis protein CheZ
MGDNQTHILSKLRTELTNLARYVDQSRQGIDSLESAVKIGSEKFPEASSQLSSVTGDLENAANNIMGIVEGLLSEHDRMRELLESFSHLVSKMEEKQGSIMLKELMGMNGRMKRDMMEIFSNLSFHDLSGQKLKNVIRTLATVEAKILEIAINFGFADEKRRSSKLLEGFKGASDKNLIDQDVVDRILSELGA